jgi:REP element-mobilizing transposase RayT
MAHTYPNVLIHCIFSTKLRRDSIPDNLHEKLSMYFVGIGKSHDIRVLCAGGTANHAHLLIVLPATITLAKAIQVLKANSSRWRVGMDSISHGRKAMGRSASAPRTRMRLGITSNISRNTMRSILLRMNLSRSCGNQV